MAAWRRRQRRRRVEAAMVCRASVAVQLLRDWLRESDVSIGCERAMSFVFIGYCLQLVISLVDHGYQSSFEPIGR